MENKKVVVVYKYSTLYEEIEKLASIIVDKDATNDQIDRYVDREFGKDFAWEVVDVLLPELNKTKGVLE